MTYDKITRRHVAIGAAIERAAKDLPKGYDLTIELERDAGTVALWIPPVSGEEGGRRVDDLCGEDIAERIENAIEMAIEHAEEVGAGETANAGNNAPPKAVAVD